MKQVVERGADLMENLGTLTNDIRDVIAQVQNGNGTIGKLLNDPELYNHLNSTAVKLDTMASNIQQGQGSARQAGGFGRTVQQGGFDASPKRMTFSAPFTIRRARSAS